MLSLVIGNKNYSSWSLRAWLLLAAFEVPFREIPVVLSVDSTADRIARYSQAGRVPVLIDGELQVWDSLAINEYINEKYLAGKGWPEDLATRARGRSVAAEMHSGFEVLRTHMPMNCRASNRHVENSPALEADIHRIEQLWVQLREIHGDNGPWLLGPFSIADCSFAPVVSRFLTYGVSLSEPAAQYRDTLLNHPAMQRWVAAACAETEVIEQEETGRSSE